jgi:hypothetical protein
MINRRQQRGVTMVGMVLWGIVIVFLALVAMKLVPAYAEFMTVKKILTDIGGETGVKSMSNPEIRDRFARRAMIDNISTVTPADLKIDHVNGRTVVSVDYTFQTPLVANVSLLVDFSASSDGRESKMAQQLDE